MAAAPNVWTQMNYVAPRGQCNFKQSVLSPRCPCLRFMLHPLKSASSYECDGCSHHASFHNMENKAEDEIRKRWEQEAKDKADQDEAVQPRPMKRVRTIEYQSAMASGGLLNMLGSASSNNTTATRGRGAAPKRPNRTAATRARGKVTEAAGEEDDDDDAVVEID